MGSEFRDFIEMLIDAKLLEGDKLAEAMVLVHEYEQQGLDDDE